MRAAKRSLGWACLIAMTLLVGGAPTIESGASTCYGTLYDYYENGRYETIVSSKVVCPGYPDQYDTDANGNFQPTPYYTTQTIVCPCPSGGGGNNGGAVDTEDDG